MGTCHTQRLSIFSISDLESGTKHELVPSPGDSELEGSRSKHLVGAGEEK